MKIAFPLTAVVLTGWIVSCTPVTEDPPPTPPTDVAENSAAEKKKSAAGEMNADGDGGAQADDLKKKTDDQKITERIEDPKPNPPKTKNAVPVARRVPGREGFVFSPYNNKMINVKDFTSGTMVADPTYPPSEKKYFRVP